MQFMEIDYTFLLEQKQTDHFEQTVVICSMSFYTHCMAGVIYLLVVRGFSFQATFANVDIIINAQKLQFTNHHHKTSLRVTSSHHVSCE